MVIDKVKGTVQLVFANEKVRLGIMNVAGHISYIAYVHPTKTLHRFQDADTMQDFSLHMGLIPANEPITQTTFKERIKPFVLRKWKERQVKAVSINNVSFSDKTDAFQSMNAQISKGHTLTRGSGIMAESTWTEFDNEVFFIAPHGVILGQPGIRVH